MPFLYEFRIDNVKVEGQIGFSTSRKWEEALDESTIVIPFTYENEIPYKMFSILSIEIIEIDNYTDRNTIATRNRDFIVYSDNITALGSYGYYRHQVNAIEYTAKLDYYMINNLSKSRSVLKNTLAPFTTSDFMDGGFNENFNPYFTLENIGMKEDFYANKELVFEQVYQSYIAWLDVDIVSFKRGDAIIKTNAPLVSGTSPHTLSDGPANWVFPTGEWEIEYGTETDGTEGNGVIYEYGVGFQAIYTFYVEAVDQYESTMYDIVNEIRESVSKYGGIEDTLYFNSTRIFDIDIAYEDYLKSVQAPQIYLSQATARQMLVYSLSFMNMLPRLELGVDIPDTLTFEEYNLSNGDLDIKDVIAYGGSQNTNQIGTKNYQTITQALANNLDDTSVYSPSRSGYQQVRSLEMQITANNFSLKLPDKAPLYTPKKLAVIIPKIELYHYESATVIHTLTDFELDLTTRWINIEEWKLKNITTNFPTITSKDMWENDLGLRENMVENLSWQVGDTEINLSTVYGVLFGANLITNVIEMAVYEYIMLNPAIPTFPAGTVEIVLGVILDIPGSSEYKDWKFRLEYITDERLVIKQDKEDLEQVSFYSEMRQNQEQSLVDLVRQSRKGYGDLQRTGNMSFSFPKKHLSLSEFYSIGQKDSEDYTITQIDTQWYNDYAIATYGITKHHNRIQQATFVNQKYRPFDNFAKTVLNRHEHYGDYLIALPPGDTESGITVQNTKIYSNDETVRTIVGILLGDAFGDSPKESATVALIRTDGMLNANPESGDNRKFIVSPLTARGVKGGFAFSLGFQASQTAGSGLVEDGGNYFNRAVSYTDKKGRFTRFGFAIMKDLEFDIGDYGSFPLIENDTTVFDAYFNDNTYFYCGAYTLNEPFANPLVWNKDPMTNAQLTYQLNVVSYYMGLYIFGLKFFTNNFIVKDHIQLNGAKLYLYNDGTTKYEMFEDLFIKDGYSSAITLLENGNVEYDDVTNTVSFIGIDLTGITSWAIGITNEDGNIELLVACNEGLNGVKFVNRHFRPNVKEIGNKELLIIVYNITMGATASASMTYLVALNVIVDLSVAATTSSTMTYLTALNAVLNATNVANANVNMTYSIMLNAVLNATITANASSTMTYDLALNFDANITNSVSASNVMTYSLNLNPEPVEWIEIESGTVTGGDCVILDDLGNIKEEEIPTCSFIQDGAAYESGTDLTEPAPTCQQNATYTLCFLLEGIWYCQDYIGEESTEIQLYECQLK